MQPGSWILLSLAFSYFNLNNTGAIGTSAALQTLLSHEAGQGSWRYVPVVRHLHSSWPLPALTSRNSPVRASLSYTHLPLCFLRVPEVSCQARVGLVFGIQVSSLRGLALLV